MSRELDRLPCQADVEATLAGLNQQLDDLRDEIRKVCAVSTYCSPNLSCLQRSKDIQQYTTEVENREKRLSSILHDTVSSHDSLHTVIISSDHRRNLRLEEKLSRYHHMWYCRTLYHIIDIIG